MTAERRKLTLPEFARLRVSQEFSPKWVEDVTDELIAHMSDGGGSPFTREFARVVMTGYEDHKRTGALRYGTATASDSAWDEARWTA